MIGDDKERERERERENKIINKKTKSKTVDWKIENKKTMKTSCEN